MLKKHLFRSKSLLGLDIQPDMARLVQVNGGQQIERIAMRPMPANVFNAGKIQQWETLSTVLAEWFESLSIREQPVAISLPMSVVRVQRLLLPASLREADIKTAIDTHLQHDMPGLNEPLSIDFSVLPHKQPGYVDVLFTAVRESYLLNYVECVQMAGLLVKVVDVDLYALMRVVNVAEATVGVLHVKNKMTEFIVFSQLEVVFHQQWETGELSQWVQQLEDNMQLFVAMQDRKKLEKIVVCSTEKYGVAAVPVIARSALCDEANQASTLVEPDYLIAYSLAMRASPPW